MVLDEVHTSTSQEEQPVASFLLESPLRAAHYREKKREARGEVERHSIWGWCQYTHVSTNGSQSMGVSTKLCEVVGSNGLITGHPHLSHANIALMRLGGRLFVYSPDSLAVVSEL